MKKILLVATAIFMVLSCVSCGNEKGSGSTDKSQSQSGSAGSEETTDGEKLVALFNTEASGGSVDLEKTAELLSEKVLGDYSCMIMPVSEGYLEGFDADVSGFAKAVTFRPMIGSIPLMGYIFECSDSKAFEDFLKKNANPAWNICTEAKETVSSVQGSYVLFAMLPGEEDF